MLGKCSLLISLNFSIEVALTSSSITVRLELGCQCSFSHKQTQHKSETPLLTQGDSSVCACVFVWTNAPIARAAHVAASACATSLLTQHSLQRMPQGGRCPWLHFAKQQVLCQYIDMTAVCTVLLASCMCCVAMDITNLRLYTYYNNYHAKIWIKDNLLMQNVLYCQDFSDLLCINIGFGLLFRKQLANS